LKQVTSYDANTIKQLELLHENSASFETCSPVIVNLYILKRANSIDMKALKFKF